jgi:hypothetical protein
VTRDDEFPSDSVFLLSFFDAFISSSNADGLGSDGFMAGSLSFDFFFCAVFTSRVGAVVMISGAAEGTSVTSLHAWSSIGINVNQLKEVKHTSRHRRGSISLSLLSRPRRQLRIRRMPKLHHREPSRLLGRRILHRR